MLDLAGLRILVVGLGPKTGVSAVRLLAARGALVTAADDKPEAELASARQALAGVPFTLVAGGIPAALADAADLVLLSPGVPRGIPVVARAAARGIEAIGDIELAARLLPNRLIGITGTDGKSTTTTMVGAVFAAAGRGRIAGNIGYPVLDLVGAVPPGELIALELSSFQLESIAGFKPAVGALLNLAADHLDRYATMDGYLAAKLRLFRNFDESCVAVLPLDHARFAGFRAGVPAAARLVTFAWSDARADVRQEAGRLVVDGEACLDFTELSVVGAHNHLNAIAAAAVCRAAGLAAAEIRAGLLAFRGLPHRYEFAGRAGGVTFINDSKATTISAVATALASAEARACVLIGGRDKGLDFRPLADAINAKDLLVFPFGEARDKVRTELAAAASRLAPAHARLGDAARAAYAAAREAGRPQVVLAPGCTSYDEFDNFEERGAWFKDLVAALAGEAR